MAYYEPKYGISSPYTLFSEAPNLACNRCGRYGAQWYPDERPGVGCLALCPEHARELDAEHKRHYEALKELRKVNYEQGYVGIRALSIQEPWLTLIVDGKKTIETRTWMTAYRGELLLVGSKKPSGHYAGVAACLVDLVECRDMHRDDEEAACCGLYPRAKAWVLENVRKVEPVGIRGKLGLYWVEKWKIKEVKEAGKQGKVVK